MTDQRMYIELKSRYSDDGPAWIGWVRFSKSSRTLYFNGHAFQNCIGDDAHYVEMETGKAYWISGLKKNRQDRHGTGYGKITIDRRFVTDYLERIGKRGWIRAVTWRRIWKMVFPSSGSTVC